MDAYDRFWHWAEKPLESPLTLPADLRRSWSSPPRTGGTGEK